MIDTNVNEPDNTVWVVYEGKGGNSLLNWTNIQNQLLAFLVASVGLGDKTCWAIGTKGSEVRFWRFTKRKAVLGWDMMVPLSVANGAVLDLNSEAGKKEQAKFIFNIATVAGWADVELLLAAIFAQARY